MVEITDKAVDAAAACIKGGSIFDQEDRKDMARAALTAALPFLAAQPAPVLEKLGRFDHHPDPAINFEIEVQSLEARLLDAKAGYSKMGTEPETVVTVLEAIERAMTFRVGGDPSAVSAKQTLRRLEDDAKTFLRSQQAPTAAVTAAESWHINLRAGIAIREKVSELTGCTIDAAAAADILDAIMVHDPALRARAEQRETPSAVVGEDQPYRDLLLSLEQCERGLTINDVLANYRTVRRTVQAILAAPTSDGR